MTDTNGSKNNLPSKNILEALEIDEKRYNFLVSSTSLRNAADYPNVVARALILAKVYGVPYEVDPISPVLMKEKWQLWKNLTFYLSLAESTKLFVAREKSEFGEMKSFSYGDLVVKSPEWCVAYVRKISPRGREGLFASNRIYYKEATKNRKPFYMWASNPSYMMEKSALSSALRIAFPGFGEPDLEKFEKVAKILGTHTAIGRAEEDIFMPAPESGVAEGAEEPPAEEVPAAPPPAPPSDEPDVPLAAKPAAKPAAKKAAAPPPPPPPPPAEGPLVAPPAAPAAPTQASTDANAAFENLD